MVAVPTEDIPPGKWGVFSSTHGILAEKAAKKVWVKGV
jgi:hypothetical protein